MAQAGHVGNHGLDGGFAEGVETWAEEETWIIDIRTREMEEVYIQPARYSFDLYIGSVKVLYKALSFVAPRTVSILQGADKMDEHGKRKGS